MNAIHTYAPSYGSRALDEPSTDHGKSQISARKTHEHRAHEHGEHERTHRHDRAHGRDRSARDARVFALEVRQSFAARFSSLNVSAGTAEEVTDPASAASSLLATARQIIASSDEDRASSMAAVRSEVHAAAGQAKSLVGTEGSAIDEAVALVDRGLDELAAEPTQQSSAVSVSAKLRQSYALSIRTQEGDIVKISLRQRDRLEATQTSAESSSGSAQVTELQLRSSTKLSLRIEGDLSEAELAAIESVFDQAAGIADAFFSGDVAAAAASTDQFAFDSTQLAKIDLSLRSRFSASATYVRSTTPQPVPAIASESSTSPAATAPAQTTAEPTEAVVSTSESTGDGNTPATIDAPAPSDTAAPTTGGSGFASLDDFVAALQAFFEGIVKGLDDLQTDQSSASHTRHRYTVAFKTEALRLSLLAAAPAESTETATQVADTIAEAATPSAA